MSYPYNPNKRTRVSSDSINYVRQLLDQQVRSLSIVDAPVASSTENECDYSEFMNFNDESEDTNDVLESEGKY